MVGESQEPVGAGVGGSQSSNKTPTLEEYGTNLTKQAEEVGSNLVFLLCYLSYECHGVFFSQHIREVAFAAVV